MAARTWDQHVWQSMARYQQDDLKGYPLFLPRRGRSSLADQCWKGAADPEKSRIKTAHAP